MLGEASRALGDAIVSAHAEARHSVRADERTRARERAEEASLTQRAIDRLRHDLGVHQQLEAAEKLDDL